MTDRLSGPQCVWSLALVVQVMPGMSSSSLITCFSWAVQAASSSRVAAWTFTVRGSETLKLPAGSMTALKLEHASDGGDNDLQSTLWLAPGMQYLPVRIRMLEDGGRDELDLKLQSHAKP